MGKIHKERLMGIKMSGLSIERSSLLLEEMLDIDWIQMQQEHFCSVTNLFVYCVDGVGKPITGISGEKEQGEQIYQIIRQEHFQELFDRISKDELEEQIIESTRFTNLKLAVFAVTDGTKRRNHLFYVFVAGVFAAERLEEGKDTFNGRQTTTEEQFLRSIDLLRNMYQKVFETVSSAMSTEVEIRRSRLSQQEAVQSLIRMEAMTEIVRLSESDGPIEVILEKILSSCGTYLQISSAQIFRLRRDEQNVVILTQWYREGIPPLFERDTEISKNSLLLSDRLSVVGMDSAISKEEKELLNSLSQKAVVTVPISINGSISMFAVFNEQTRERSWKTEEVKFMHDAVRIMQGIMIRRIQKNSLASSYASLESILDNVGSAIYVKDAMSHKVLFVNKTMKSIFEKEMLDGTLEGILSHQIPKDMRSGKIEIFYETQKKWYDLYFTDINWVDGSKVTLYAIYDISDKKAYQKKMEQQAYTDFLTGLYNRLCCERDLLCYIEKAKENHSKGALLYLDLDDFKSINDNLGHQYGDVLLKSIAHSLQNIEEISNSCYRMGGDEFIIIISPESYNKMDYVIDKIKELFNQPWFLKDADYYCTMSMGVACFPSEGERVHDLIKKADVRMYEAKKSGKNRVAGYSGSSDIERRVNKNYETERIREV